MRAAENQIELFATSDAPLAQLAPKLGLPFQKSNTIDVKRAMNIFRVSKQTVLRMREAGLLRGYKLHGVRAPWQIEYSSVVDHCDRLRVVYGISDSRAALPPGHKRRRDEDLLPFPYAQTIFVADAQRRLDCHQSHVLHLIESGVLVAYRLLIDTEPSTWRIHEPSLDRYMARLHEMATSPRPCAKRRA